MDLIDLSQSRNKWWAFVIAIMNLWVPWYAWIYLLSEEPLASQEGLYSMDLVIIPGFTDVLHRNYIWMSVDGRVTVYSDLQTVMLFLIICVCFS